MAVLFQEGGINEKLGIAHSISHETREENRETINARKRAYRATDEGKKKTSEYNRKYRLEHYERECARKREWWRRTHPNPKPKGRPRKEA